MTIADCHLLGQSASRINFSDGSRRSPLLDVEVKPQDWKNSLSVILSFFPFLILDKKVWHQGGTIILFFTKLRPPFTTTKNCKEILNKFYTERGRALLTPPSPPPPTFAHGRSKQTMYTFRDDSQLWTCNSQINSDI
jgi:hypothetical protein